jgi:uncharacterized phage protein gp47/JayE
MAFEDMTYEYIMQRMTDRVSEQNSNLDTREGSILFNAHAPAAIEMAIAYTEIDNAINESFIDTASREYILTHCKQMGMDISVFEAKAGTHLGVFNVEVAIGSRWNCDLYNYVVTEPYTGTEHTIDEGEYGYNLVCETTGTAPNNVTGELTPIDDAPTELSYKELVACLIQGENEFTDDEIRQAYYDYVNDTQTDGNVAQYEKWCREFGGIGNHKVFPMWDENNTNGNVKVSILNEDNTLASEELIAKFQNYLDPGSTGMGNGKAPIGAVVTVTTSKPVKVKLDVILSYVNDMDETLAKTILDDAIKNYFAKIAYKTNVISKIAIAAEILKLDCVDYVGSISMGIDNGDWVNDDYAKDYLLRAEEIPVLEESFYGAINV